jgi:hypothetical protein
LVVVELIVCELSADLATACAACPKKRESGHAVEICDVCGVLRFVLWGASEHGQNTRKEMIAT